MRAEESSLEVDGRRIAVNAIGEGPPLVLVNGYAATAADWDPGYVEGLAAERTVVLPNNRGMGGSELGQGSFSIADLAVDVLAVMDGRGIESAPVIGWSMGGMIAQELLTLAPERVSALVLMSTDRGGHDAVYSDPETWNALGDYSGTPEEQARRLLSLIFPAELAAQIYEQVGEDVARARAALSHEALDAQHAALEVWRETGPDLGPVQGPLMVACGTEDRVIPPENSLRLARLTGSSWLIRFPGGGHAFMAQFPRQLAAATNLFLETVGADA